MTHIDCSEKVLGVKIFLSLLIFIISLQFWTKADDIRDFEIEGVSIGDSLLEYYNPNQIENFIRNDYNYGEFYKLEITDKLLLKKLIKYDSISFHIKRNDNDFIVQHIGGNIFFNKIKDCLNEQKNITNQISKALNIEFTFRKLISSSYKNTKYYQSEGAVENGGVIAITCYDWSKKDQDKYGWKDNLSVEIFSSEVANFIRDNS